MKKDLLFLTVCLIYIMGYVFFGCKKDKDVVLFPGISQSFTQEFTNFYKTVNNDDWVANTAIEYGSLWDQGIISSIDKGGMPYGFSAYSYTNAPDEYAGVFNYEAQTTGMNSWLITPVLYVKNGDKISFYTRSDSTLNADRLMVFMNKSASKDVGNTAQSVGDFALKIMDINPGQVVNGYPKTWTKQEYTVTGIDKKTNVRFGFRYYVPAGFTSRGIGIDQFKFETN